MRVDLLLGIKFIYILVKLFWVFHSLVVRSAVLLWLPRTESAHKTEQSKQSERADQCQVFLANRAMTDGRKIEELGTNK